MYVIRINIVPATSVRRSQRHVHDEDDMEREERSSIVRDGQTGRPARPEPSETRPVLGPARQARLENRAGPCKPVGLTS